MPAEQTGLVKENYLWKVKQHIDTDIDIDIILTLVHCFSRNCQTLPQQHLSASFLGHLLFTRFVQ